MKSRRPCNFSNVILLLAFMRHRLFIAGCVCFALLSGCSLWSPESSFFSKFSVQELVERNKASAGLNCDPLGGGGGGIGSRAGGLGSRGAHFNSHKSDSYACRLQSPEAFDEGRLFSALKLDVERTLRDLGAQITQTGSSGPANFYFAYSLKNVSGRVELTGTKTGSGYYDVRADLNETGN
jgi:hypothetical protein